MGRNHMEFEQLAENLCSETIEQEISRLPNNVVIYGAGAFGKEVYTLLKAHDIPVLGFIDGFASAGDQLYGLHVWNLNHVPEDVRSLSPLVLFAIVMDYTERQQVILSIKRAGFPDIREAQSLRCFMVEPDDRTEHEGLLDYYTRRWPKIQKAATLFREKKSNKLFWMNLTAHITRDYTKCMLEDPIADQYFPKDIAWKKHSYIVDCGAYIGDTAQQFTEQEGQLEHYIGFEPNQDNFKRLVSFCRLNSEKFKNITLFPCGVSGRTQALAFRSGTGSGHLDQFGDKMVYCAALDDVLQGHPVDLIKMDIEGAEIEAVRAAQKLISCNKPDLEICVYHNTNHLWDIPLLLNSWDLNYQFYLRSYNACTMETVLYATSTE